MTQDESIETIGQRVAKYRKLVGISAQKLADETGLTRSVIANIENGRKADPTISEMLALASSLRVPLAALLYPIESPLGLAASPEEGQLFGLRVIDGIDWLNGVESEIEGNDELAYFRSRLDELDAVVLYPVGLVVQAPFSKAGQQAVALINAGRALARADSRFWTVRQDFILMFREAVSYLDRPDREGGDELLFESGDASESALIAEVKGMLGEEDRLVLEKLTRRLDRAAVELRRARDAVRALGGDPTPHRLASSPWQAMNLVKAAPHEPLAETRDRGELADGIVSSPLREHRDDRLDSVRERFGPTGSG